MNKVEYTPSKLIKQWFDEGKLPKMDKLPTVISAMIAKGFDCYVIETEGDEMWHINSKNVRMAVSEIDDIIPIKFIKGNESDSMLVAPDNDCEYEWLVDHTCDGVLNNVIGDILI